MKSVFRQLHLRQKVWAVVHEIFSSKALIVSLYGDLIRVENLSSKSFRVGERVLLEVSSLDPLEFQIKIQRLSNSNSIDVSI